ncbi:MAG TPA: hypothetical protein VF718_12610 [Allosphingosinicella sp.]|jgi:hypothetical protein
MLTETKDLLNFAATTSAAVLAIALTIMALVPLVIQLLSDKVRTHFAAAQAKRRIAQALTLLAISSAILLANLVLVTVSAIWCAIQPAVSVVSLAILLVALGTFAAAFAVALLVVWKASQL